jgi:hypothetical protein
LGSSAAKRAATLGADISERDRTYLESIQSKYLKLIRTAVAEHNGREVMTIGDSFFLTFAEPVDALRCCAAIQQQLADRPISTMRGLARAYDMVGDKDNAKKTYEALFVTWKDADLPQLLAAKTEYAALK